MKAKTSKTYYWECPRCNVTHAENVLICNQWSRNGECGYNSNDRPLYKKLLTTQKQISCIRISEEMASLEYARLVPETAAANKAFADTNSERVQKIIKSSLSRLEKIMEHPSWERKVNLAHEMEEELMLKTVRRGYKLIEERKRNIPAFLLVKKDHLSTN